MASPTVAGQRSEAETIARALLQRAATDPEPMLLMRAAEVLLRRG